MRVLFVGGTGIIRTACAQLAVLPAGAQTLVADWDYSRNKIACERCTREALRQFQS